MQYRLLSIKYQILADENLQPSPILFWGYSQAATHKTSATGALLEKTATLPTDNIQDCNGSSVKNALA